MAGKKVKRIAPVSSNHTISENNKLRVCAYARVSTGTKAQAESYAVQVEYYSRKIEENPLWEFVGIFADEALTGTRIKGRTEFQQMVQECEEGNIDLIITKSVTRFARNTVESIQTIRKLKAVGVGIYFEKENINTLTEKSELLLTILFSIAQGESEDFSGNNQWAAIKRFREGTYIIGTPAYGYYNDENGNLTIQPKEAEVVRQIFHLYLNGMGTYRIAKQLNETGIPTKRSAKQWEQSTIKEILKNPVYEGDLLHQKTYTERTFPFQHKVNKGQMVQYLVENDHPPIITREEAEAVRQLLKYRTDTLHMTGTKSRNRYVFSGRIKCGGCGRYLRRQKIYIGKSFEKIIWSCPKHIENKEICKMKAIREDEVHNAFLVMWNKLFTNPGTVLEPLLEGLKQRSAIAEDNVQNEQLNQEIQNLTEQCRILNQVMKKGYMDTALFMENYNRLIHRLAEIKRKKAVYLRRQKRTKEIVQTELLLNLLKNESAPLKEFREDLFDLAVDEINISLEHTITFCLKNGLELSEDSRKERKGGGEDAVAHTNGI